MQSIHDHNELVVQHSLYPGDALRTEPKSCESRTRINSNDQSSEFSVCSSLSNERGAQIAPVVEKRSKNAVKITNVSNVRTIEKRSPIKLSGSHANLGVRSGLRLG